MVLPLQPFLESLLQFKVLTCSSTAKIILDNHLKTPLNCNVIKSKSKGRTFIFYNKKNIKKIQLLKKLGIKTYKIPINETGNLDLKEVLFKTKKLGFSRVFLESGIKLVTNFLKMNLIDDFNLFISNKKIKINGSGNFKNSFMKYLNKKNKRVEKINLFGEKLVSYNLK